MCSIMYHLFCLNDCWTVYYVTKGRSRWRIQPISYIHSSMLSLSFSFFIFFSFYLILYWSEKMFKFMIVRSMVGIRCKLLKRKWRRKNQQRVIELVIEQELFNSLNNMFQFFCFFGGLKHFKVFGGKQLFYLQTYSSLYRFSFVFCILALLYRS